MRIGKDDPLSIRLNEELPVPFIAVCPHCRNCRLRAPRAKRGKTVRCPKCEQAFLLVPLEETAPNHESSPTPVSTPAPRPSPGEEAEQIALRLGHVSLGAVGVAFLLSQLPYGRAVAVLAALFGAGAGLQALLETDGRRRGWPGLVLNILMLMIVVAFPATLGVRGWWPAQQPAPAANAQFPDSIDAGEAAWQQGGVRVGLTFATVGADSEKTAQSGRNEPLLWIGVKVTYLGVGSQLEFTGWSDSGERRPTLTTADGTEYAVRRRTGPSGKVLLQPGQELECMIGFEAPPPGQDLLLHLPGLPFGDASPIRFRVPHELIGRQ